MSSEHAGRLSQRGSPPRPLRLPFARRCNTFVFFLANGSIECVLLTIFLPRCGCGLHLNSVEAGGTVDTRSGFVTRHARTTTPPRRLLALVLVRAIDFSCAIKSFRFVLVPEVIVPQTVSLPRRRLD